MILTMWTIKIHDMTYNHLVQNIVSKKAYSSHINLIKQFSVFINNKLPFKFQGR
jgi:hypothetical protein